MTRKAFTLIEVLVAISIIAILAMIMVAVGSSVQKNSRINQTRAQLKALEGIVEQFERDNSIRIQQGTVYATAASGWQTIKNPTASDISQATNYANILSIRSRGVDGSGNIITSKSSLDVLGAKVVNSSDSPPLVTIRDSWGNPIHFFQQNWQPTPSMPVAQRMHVRSSGPDGLSDFSNPAATVNNDDIYSYEP